MEHLGRELSGVRTGRANPGLLENIPVEAYGEKLPLKACGAVTVRNPQLLAVAVFDSGVSRGAGWERSLATGRAARRTVWLLGGVAF